MPWNCLMTGQKREIQAFWKSLLWAGWGKCIPCGCIWIHVCAVSTSRCISITCGGLPWSLPEGFQAADHPKAAIRNKDSPFIQSLCEFLFSRMTGKFVFVFYFFRLARRFSQPRRRCARHFLFFLRRLNQLSLMCTAFKMAHKDIPSKKRQMICFKGHI